MLNSPRALVFAPAFAPNFFSEALVNSKLVLAMLNANWDVTVISAAANTEFAYSNSWEPPWEPLRNVVHVIPVSSRNTVAALIRAARAAAVTRHLIPGAVWAMRAADLALAMHRQRPFDFMLTRSTSCVAHLPGLVVKRRTGLRWVANWNDPPAHCFPAPYAYDLPPSKKVLTEFYLRHAARQAEVNTFPSRQLLDYLAGPLGLSDPSRVAVVPHVGLGWRGKPARYDKTRLRICHAGNLSAERDPRKFLRALAKARGWFPDLRFEFNVIGRMPEEAQREIELLDLLDVVTFTPDLSYWACLEHLEQADVLLLVEAPVERGIFFPSKIVDYAEAGRPILALSPSNGFVQDLNQRFQVGYIAEASSEACILAAIVRLAKDWLEGRVSYAGLADLRDYTSPKTVMEQISNLAGIRK